ncbi:MAG: TadE family protein [Gemmatimonas sp.]
MSRRGERARRRLVRLRRSEHGGAMLELAVVLPVLILIAIGVMDYGRVYFTSIAVANAARAAAEYGTAMTGNQNKTANIQSMALLDGAEAGSMTITPVTTCKCGATVVACSGTTCAGYGVPRVYVAVTATKDVALILKYPGLPATVTISRTATFRLQ